MDSRGETSGVIRVVERVTEYARRGVLSSREAVNKITDELAYYRRGDLAETVLPLLTPELFSELQRWVHEVLQPGYRYRWIGLGSALSEADRLKTEAELKALATLISHCGEVAAQVDRGSDAADA